MEKKLKARIKEAIQTCDLIIQRKGENDVGMHETIREIVKKDKVGENTEELIAKYVNHITDGTLLSEDTVKHFQHLITLYKFAKEVEVDIELEDKDVQRLEYLVENNKPFYVLVKGELKVVDEEAAATIKHTELFDKGKLLEMIRGSQFYNEEGKE